MGNRFGWILAGVLVLVFVVIFLLVAIFPSPSGPTSATTKAGVLDLHVQRLTPKDLTGRESTAPGNAGELYSRAYKQCRTNWELIEKIQFRIGGLLGLLKNTEEPVNLSSEEVAMLSSIADLVNQGARRKEMHFALKYTPEDLPVIGNLDIAERIVDLQHALILYSSYLARQSKYTEAERAMEDMLTMGYHFATEGALIRLTKSGLSFQRQACSILDRLYTRPFDEAKGSRRTQVREYRNSLDVLSSFIDSKLNVTRRLKNVEKFPGDVFNIIDNDADRLWRVEGILKLGQLKFTVQSRGDKRYVRKLIAKYLDSDDSLEATAARIADAYTIEEYRRSGQN